MKEKSQVLKTRSRSENTSHHKALEERHRQAASNSDKDKTEPQRYRSSSKSHSKKSAERKSTKESSKKKNYRDEVTYDDEYEELSRKKRKIESELHALDLEEAAAKKQKLGKKTSKHQNLSDKDEPSSEEDRCVASARNRQKLGKKSSKHQNLSDKDEPSSDEDRCVASIRNRQKLEKTSRHQNVIDKGEPFSEEDNRLTSERNRSESFSKKQRQEKKSSRHQNVSEKDEPLSDEANGGRNRQKLEKKTSKYRNVTVKDEALSDEERRLASVRNRQKQRQQNLRIKDEPSSDEDTRLPRSSSRISAKDKDKPDFAVSGKLAEDTNVFNGVVIKYNEPSEARKPKRRWRLYPFKGESDLPFIPIHRQSAYLLGRTRAIADIPIDHPSCSKQHAVLQFRLVPYTRDDGTKGRRVRPYIIDLESANGTFVNNNRINPRCYVELMEKDVIKFGFSSREYVLLHEESKNDDYDDVRDSN